MLEMSQGEDRGRPRKDRARLGRGPSEAGRAQGCDRAREGCLVAHDCGYPLSRYTCRATRVAADFLDFIAF